MKIETKTSFILLVTLLIGIAIGFLFNRVLDRKKVDQFRDLHESRGFFHLFERILDPTPAQQDTMQQILDGYFARFRDLRRHQTMELRALVDSLEADLMPVLTEEQKKRLLEKRQLFKDRPRRFPPPGRPPVHAPGDSGIN
ncbi:hypothetical protein GF407_19520 [candidate division KSB1 bacterium]|nr:hypothetical protein [candidate division KSB1 bacterium]